MFTKLSRAEQARQVRQFREASKRKAETVRQWNRLGEGVEPRAPAQPSSTVTALSTAISSPPAPPALTEESIGRVVAEAVGAAVAATVANAVGTALANRPKAKLKAVVERDKYTGELTGCRLVEE